jgi:hypothetical protein
MSSIASNLKTARDLFAATRTRIRELDARTVELQTERARIVGLPLTKDDFVKAAELDVRRRSQRFGHMYSTCLMHHADRRISWEAAMNVGSNGLHLHLLAGDLVGREIREDAIFFYFGEQMAVGIQRIADGMTWSPDAMPTEERLDLLGKIDAELSRIGAERAELADALSAGPE